MSSFNESELRNIFLLHYQVLTQYYKLASETYKLMPLFVSGLGNGEFNISYICLRDIVQLLQLLSHSV